MDSIYFFFKAQNEKHGMDTMYMGGTWVSEGVLVSST